MLKKRVSEAWSHTAKVLLVLLAAMHLASAQTIILQLKNGDRVTGRVVSETTNSVSIATPFLGTVQVPLTEVTNRVVVPEPAPAAPVAPPATNPPPAAAVPVPAATNAPAVVTNAPAATTNSPAAASAKAPAPKKAKEPVGPIEPANPEAKPIAATPSLWKHDIRFGLNMRYANKDSHEFLTIIKSTYASKPFRHIFDVNFKYGRVEGNLAANSLSGSEKTEYQLSPRFYWFSLVGGGYDEIRDIDVQFDFGPGMGVELIKMTNFVWKGELGFNFQRQYRADDTRETAYSMRIAEIFAWRIWENLTADAKVEFFPNIDEFGEYRLRLESTLRYPVSKRMSLNLDLIDLYDTQPSTGVKPNDLQIRSTIGVTF